MSEDLKVSIGGKDIVGNRGELPSGLIGVETLRITWGRDTAFSDTPAAVLETTVLVRNPEVLLAHINEGNFFNSVIRVETRGATGTNCIFYGAVVSVEFRVDRHKRWLADITAADSVRALDQTRIACKWGLPTTTRRETEFVAQRTWELQRVFSGMRVEPLGVFGTKYLLFDGYQDDSNAYYTNSYEKRNFIAASEGTRAYYRSHLLRSIVANPNTPNDIIPTPVPTAPGPLTLKPDGSGKWKPAAPAEHIVTVDGARVTGENRLSYMPENMITDIEVELSTKGDFSKETLTKHFHGSKNTTQRNTVRTTEFVQYTKTVVPYDGKFTDELAKRITEIQNQPQPPEITLHAATLSMDEPEGKFWLPTWETGTVALLAGFLAVDALCRAVPGRQPTAWAIGGVTEWRGDTGWTITKRLAWTPLTTAPPTGLTWVELDKYMVWAEIDDALRWDTFNELSRG
ncbi:hypothetical protein ACL1FZ_08585 [Corynebacterium striatum]